MIHAVSKAMRISTIVAVAAVVAGCAGYGTPAPTPSDVRIAQPSADDRAVSSAVAFTHARADRGRCWRHRARP